MLAQQEMGTSSSEVPVNPLLSCPHGSCDHLECSSDGLSAESSFEAIDKLYEDIDSYHQIIKEAVVDIREVQEEWIESLEDASSNRHTKRSILREAKAQFNDIRKDEVANIKMLLSSALGCDNWDEFPAIETDLKELTLFQKDTKRFYGSKFMGLIVNFATENQKLFNAYKRALLSELQARTALAIFQAQNPQLANQLFQADHFKDMPDAMQRIIAADISRGESSVILQHKIRLSKLEGESSCHPLEGITPNRLSKESKLFLQAVGLGAAAMGATTCPMNEFGICRRVLERVELPEEIQTEIENKKLSQSREDVRKLKHVASHVGSNPLHINAKDDPLHSCITEPKTKRRGCKQEVERAAEPTKPEQEAIPFSKITVIIPGHERILINPGDETSISSAIDSLINSDLVNRYMQRHNARGIHDFFEQAIKTLLFCPAYQTETAIRKVVCSPEVQVDDKKTRLYRLSGHKLIGSSGGPIGKDTRIFFAPVTEGQERTVVISEIMHKNELTKGIPQSVYNIAV